LARILREESFAINRRRVQRLMRMTGIYLRGYSDARERQSRYR
jgi:hypothetical protein